MIKPFKLSKDKLQIAEKMYRENYIIYSASEELNNTFPLLNMVIDALGKSDINRFQLKSLLICIRSVQVAAIIDIDKWIDIDGNTEA